MLKRPSILISLLCIMGMYAGAGAQNKTASDSSLLFTHNFVSAYIAGTGTTPKYVFSNGNTSAKPADIGFEFGGKYTYNIGQLFAVETGIGFGRQYYYFASGNHSLGFGMNFLKMDYAQIPLMLQVRGELGKHFFIYMAGGIAAKFFTDNRVKGVNDANFGTGNQDEITGYSVSYFSVDSNVVNIVSNFELGAYYQLPNNNMLRLNAVFQLSQSNKRLINYDLLNSKSDILGVGTYYIPMSYTGFSLAYVFTRSGKK